MKPFIPNDELPVNSFQKVVKTTFIKTPLNSSPDSGKTFTMPSLTVPDQTLTIRQIMDRYARGLPLEVKTPVWDENIDEDNPEFIPDPRTMDLVDRQLFKEQAIETIAEIKSKRTKKPIEVEKTPSGLPPSQTPPIVEN